MAKDEMDVVSRLRQAIADKVGQDRTEMWLRAGEAISLDDGALVVTAADEFSLDRIRRTLRDELIAAAEPVLGRRPQLLFRLDGATKRGPTRAPHRNRAAAIIPSNQKVFSFAENGDEPHHSNAAAPVTHAPGIDATPVVSQVASDATFTTRRFARLDSFVACDASRLAHGAAIKAVKQPGQVSPLYLYGPTGCGKTHLAEGIWSATRRSPGNRQCVFLAAEQFTTMFLESLHGQGLPSFRRKVREVDLLIIDDIQFLHGKRATLQELLNTVEHFARNQKQLVLTADRAPAELPAFGAELMARLMSGLVADLPALDLDSRRAVLTQQLAARGRTLFPDVLEMLAAELPGDGRRLQGALNRLEATQEALGRTLTLALARESLKDLIRTNQKMVRLIDIDKAVCEVFGLAPKSLHTEAKSRSITTPRMLAMWLARKHTRAGLSEISDHFGLRSHSTVVAAQKKVTIWIAGQTSLALQQGSCDAQEAVRRVETTLRAM